MGGSVYRERIVIFVACLFTALYALVLHAAPVDGRKAILQIAELPVASGTPAADQVVQGGLDASFMPSRSPYTPNAVDSQRWYRLSTDIDWNEATSPVLNFTGASYIRLTVYAPPDYRPQALWFAHTDGIRRFSRHHLAMELPRDLRAGQPIYVQIAADSFPRQIKPAITDLAHYQEQDLTHVRLITLFASVQFTMIMAALCLWLILRDRTLAYFIGYATFQLIYQLLMSGEIYELPGGKLLVPLDTHAPWFFAALSAPLSFSFIKIG